MNGTVIRRRLLAVAAFSSLLGTSAFSQIEVVIPFAPVPAHIKGRTVLAYEVHITNFTPLTWTLDRVEALTPEGLSLASYHERDLSDSLRRPGPVVDPSQIRAIGPGLRAIELVWLTLKDQQALPSALLHKVYLTAPNSGTGRAETDEFQARVSIRKEQPLVIAPPLRGSGWVAGNGPSNVSVHRRMVFPLSSRTTATERFAYDFVQLGPDGIAMRGDRLKNSSFHGYGAEVLAVADGKVWAVHDGVAENIPFSKPTEGMNAETSGGNYVTIDLGHDRYAFYGHLQPKSLRVKVGDRVRRGQTLGLLGNSGNSDAPHLHFQISDAGKLGDGEGLPFAFESYELLGVADLIATLGLDNRVVMWRPQSAPKGSIKHREMPAENDVVGFH